VNEKDLSYGFPFAIVLSLATQRSKQRETKRDERSENAEFEGVDELHAVPHNLASLLQTNTTLCQHNAAIFKNQQSISVGV
jgi:hypothetical protein